jgi:hypothetical protein
MDYVESMGSPWKPVGDCKVQGIPIKYWPELYQAKKGFKSGAWKAIRVKWGNWKVILSIFFNLLLLTGAPVHG